ncbi:Fur family zinc uptake transcriptional regulator [Sinobacterium caligoides]|uniref:Fur family zinc uptake transcriptional regulator n=1 Tax=Sinobacterium caligoides TaxID=933926 RepID=A0A3N2DGT6_9GAMM|nr:Fur family transcriptional regulator [Sinobacterium caligoides]ROR98969.1 Fur family zinc uptake transcriptional regulator [Sinobacterium caligoides]
MSLAFEQHNHQHCIHDALAEAKALCEQRKLRLTSLREQVLTLLWGSHKPLGAYALLEMMQQAQQAAGIHKTLAPATVYRALDFLVDEGLAHRITSLNAFIGCCSPSSGHSSHFFICSQCENAIEITSAPISQAIASCASEASFQVHSESVEVLGVCQQCQQAT